MNHENDQDDLAFARKAAQALRHSETIDSETAAKLALARKRALAAANTPSAQLRSMWPVAAVTAAAIVAVLVLQPERNSALNPAVADASGVDTLDLLTDDMSPAFYRDLEFYQWLAQERPNA
ncbi:hypothetical protein [Stenotrophobium rhamnosiphilum]|uniref:DUF3619 domain-containing protein n=1 Tax=Stenotrophobium rhamnosiphilum TaxID=2029166 RepID=A0A2T5MFV9_9GAMM|nr:hypothetical protein [Stenotrophobium rhamnosiphilum]PTU31442.1 hypothetical protein CJD38_08870 [Stenotrophobium rhamnosiphilum]